jgi:NhaC family Na+:H+ antiporter
VPAFGIAVAVFVVLGIVRGPQAGAADQASVDLHQLGDIYHITPLNLLPLLLLGFLSIRKVPASIALICSALFAGLLGAILQYRVVAGFVDDPSGGPVVVSLKGIWSSMATGFHLRSGVADVDQLLSRGGMDSMLLTLWLIIGAVTFGTLLEEFGLISRLIDPVLRAARGTGRLYLTVAASGIGLNIVAGDQYIALVLPARLFRPEFARRGLAPTNLSRLAADCGTVTSPIVPWNSCGAFMGAVLGVAVPRYLPFAIFCLASPLLSVLYGFVGFRITKVEPTPRASGAAEPTEPIPG